MRDFTKTKKVLFTALAVIILMIIFTPLSFVDFNLPQNSGLATSTYTNYISSTERDVIQTSLSYTNISELSSTTVLCAENLTEVTQSFGYTYTETKSATANLGANVDLVIIELAAGGSVCYSTSTTISATVNVPPYKSYDVTLCEMQKSCRYTSIWQKQVLISGSWVNYGTTYTSRSTVTYKYPKIQIAES